LALRQWTVHPDCRHRTGVDEKSHFRYGLAMAETAVVVLLPELEPLIGDWRRRYTRDGARGMPPHVTLVIPFVDSSQLDDRLGALGRLFDAFAPFGVTFSATARFPGLLYLRPEPEQPFVGLTEGLVEAFPEFRPYRGEFDEIVPHATIAEADDETLAGIARALSPQLPVKARVDRAWVVEETPSGWRRRTAFPLDRRRAV
jgi:2'-5' RNA ligase